MNNKVTDVFRAIVLVIGIGIFLCVSGAAAYADSESTDAEAVEDEVSDVSKPEGTIVSVRGNGKTYYILSKPDDVDAPSGYFSVTISLNDVDVEAYIQRTDDHTVLLYAADSDDYEGWYFFDADEGTFLNAEDILDSSGGALGIFMSRNKFVIMLIAVIVLAILVVVIVILAVSLKNVMKEYEEEIDRIKAMPDDTQRINEKPAAVPMINNRALFPGDDEETHESYEDSDYDNRVSAAEGDLDVEPYDGADDYDLEYDGDGGGYNGGDYDDGDYGNESYGGNGGYAPNEAENRDIDEAGDDTTSKRLSEKYNATDEKMRASLSEIDAVLDSAKKYKK